MSHLTTFRCQVCLFLFNDLLLVAKGDIKKDKFTVIARFMREDNLRLEVMADTNGYPSPLSGRFIAVLTSDNFSLDFMGQQIKNAFVLHSPRISYLFFCISAEERNQLCDHLRAIFR